MWLQMPIGLGYVRLLWCHCFACPRHLGPGCSCMRLYTRFCIHGNVINLFMEQWGVFHGHADVSVWAQCGGVETGFPPTLLCLVYPPSVPMPVFQLEMSCAALKMCRKMQTPADDFLSLTCLWNQDLKLISAAKLQREKRDGGGVFVPFLPSFPHYSPPCSFLFFSSNILPSQCLAVTTTSSMSGLQPLHPAPMKSPLASVRVLSLMTQGCRAWLSVMP